MADETANLIIEHLKALRNELQAFRTQYDQDQADLRSRLNHVELGIAGLKRDQSHSYEDAARQQLSIDRLTERIERIERRLELI